MIGGQATPPQNKCSEGQLSNVKRSQIEEMLTNMENETARTELLLGKLMQKLQPALRSEPSVSSDCCKEASQLVPIADAVSTAWRRVVRSNDMIQDMTQRLEM
jgi:hypothetical protein